MLRLRTAVMLAAAVLVAGKTASGADGDAVRGEQLLRDLGCTGCHGPNRPDLKVTDLGRRMSRNYTPAYLASLLWNHGQFRPSVLRAALDETQTADLFAYFASRRFFEPLGDAYRGKAVFRGKCGNCHGLTQKISADSSPASAWPSLGDPIAFAQEMWNRSTAAMGESYARKGVRHPQLTSLEMNDLLIFLENVPSIPSKEASFQFATCETGPALFTAKGCASCHKGKLSFGSRSAHSNMSDFAAAMWNHAIGGHQVRQPLSYGEMSGLVSYLWSVEAMGQERKGESVFQKKNCAACHDSQTLARSMVLHHRELLPFSLLTAMGSYSTEVTTDMSQKGVVWPQLTGPEMANLAEYLSVRTGAK